jgi:hypothetical protein
MDETIDHASDGSHDVSSYWNNFLAVRNTLKQVVRRVSEAWV